MGADVEGEIARPKELAIAPPERAPAPGLAVVDDQRAREADGSGQIARGALAPFEIGRGH
jgi:hypothetical protein